MAKEFFITATGTDIGKSFILQKLCEKLKTEGKKFYALKPIISGFDYDDKNSDSAKILKLLSKSFNQKNINSVSPWRFKAPLAPSIAAALEKKKINFTELINFCQQNIKAARKNNNYLFIEGAGGIMTPITDKKTFADLIAALKIPAILIIGDYVGTISHTLTAIATMKNYKIKIAKIIINCRTDVNCGADIAKILKNFTKTKIEIN